LSFRTILAGCNFVADMSQEPTRKDIELQFMRNLLQQHGEHLQGLLKEDIDSKKLKITKDLIESFSYSQDDGALGPKLNLSFLGYGRAIEIAWHKRSRNTKELVSKTVWGIKENRPKKQKNTRWYSRNVYGSLNRLIGMVMYELDDATVAHIKSQLHKQRIHAEI